MAVNDVSLVSPTVGLTSIARHEADQARPDHKVDYHPIGGRVHQSVRRLYDQRSTRDVTLNLTVPMTVDPDLLQPQRFEPAFLNAFDKVAAHFEQDPDHAASAHDTLRRIKEAWEQCRDNIAALNQV